MWIVFCVSVIDEEVRVSDSPVVRVLMDQSVNVTLMCSVVYSQVSVVN